MSEKTSGKDGLSKGLSVAVALGALAVGVATAVVNNGRTKQVREDLRQRLDELGKRVDELTAEAQKRASDLSTQAQRTLEERRPEIESTIQKGREAVIEGLDKAKTAVEQGAEKAQEYVQRASAQAADKVDDAAGAVENVAQDASGAVGDMAAGAVDAVSGAAEGAGSSLQDAGESVKDWTGEAGRQLSQAMSDEGEHGDGGVVTGFGKDPGDGALGSEATAFNAGERAQESMQDPGGLDNGIYSGDTGQGMLTDGEAMGNTSSDTSNEDMSGNDFMERDSEERGFQMEGSMHSHDASDENRGGNPGKQTSDLNKEESTGSAGEAGAPEFGGSSATQASFNMGEPTIPFNSSSNNPEADNDVDNEPPHPGDTRTYK